MAGKRDNGQYIEVKRLEIFAFDKTFLLVGFLDDYRTEMDEIVVSHSQTQELNYNVFLPIEKDFAHVYFDKYVLVYHLFGYCFAILNDFHQFHEFLSFSLMHIFVFLFSSRFSPFSRVVSFKIFLCGN